MGQTDTDRIQSLEQASTLTGWDQHEVNKEIDSRTTGRDIWSTITRTADLITKLELFSDAAKTKKVIERTYTRTTGSDNIEYITGMLTIFYNSDSSEDSRVTTTISRTDDLLTGCANPFATGEDPGFC